MGSSPIVGTSERLNCGTYARIVLPNGSSWFIAETRHSSFIGWHFLALAKIKMQAKPKEAAAFWQIKPTDPDEQGDGRAE